MARNGGIDTAVSSAGAVSARRDERQYPQRYGSEEQRSGRGTAAETRRAGRRLANVCVTHRSHSAGAICRSSIPRPSPSGIPASVSIPPFRTTRMRRDRRRASVAQPVDDLVDDLSVTSVRRIDHAIGTLVVGHPRSVELLEILSSVGLRPSNGRMSGFAVLERVFVPATPLMKTRYARSRSRLRFSATVSAPPPSDSTLATALKRVVDRRMFVTAKRRSPSFAKIAAIGPCARATSASVSKKAQPSLRASFRPIVDLPDAMNPTSATCRFIEQRVARPRRDCVEGYRSVSSIESPPYFSKSGPMSASRTIASPTIAAAGTTQTSLRTIVAGASVP